ncbi:hypothetical protein C9J03_01570, partial [Photobacterium gaetbulicola]
MFLAPCLRWGSEDQCGGEFRAVVDGGKLPSHTFANSLNDHQPTTVSCIKRSMAIIMEWSPLSQPSTMAVTAGKENEHDDDNCRYRLSEKRIPASWG